VQWRDQGTIKGCETPLDGFEPGENQCLYEDGQAVLDFYEYDVSIVVIGLIDSQVFPAFFDL